MSATRWDVNESCTELEKSEKEFFESVESSQTCPEICSSVTWRGRVLKNLKNIRKSLMEVLKSLKSVFKSLEKSREVFEIVRIQISKCLEPEKIQEYPRPDQAFFMSQNFFGIP